MKTFHPILAGLLLLPTGALAQNAPVSRPAASASASTQAPAVCAADVTRLCAEKSLKQECLVQHWTKVSSDCQDALAKPMRGGGGGGG